MRWEIKIPILPQGTREVWGTQYIWDRRENQLQFKIKDQDYFLAFVEQEKRWYVFAPTSEGVNRIPVYVDAAKYQKPGILEAETGLSS